MKTPHYKIIKNRELPKAGRSFGNFPPLTDMEVGDCFTFNEADKERLQSLLNSYGKKNGCAFIVNVADEAVCWRVK